MLSLSIISKQNIKIENTFVGVLQLQCSGEVQNTQPSQVYLNDFFSYIGWSKTLIFTRVQIQIKRVFQKYSYCSLILANAAMMIIKSPVYQNIYFGTLDIL